MNEALIFMTARSAEKDVHYEMDKQRMKDFLANISFELTVFWPVAACVVFLFEFYSVALIMFSFPATQPLCIHISPTYTQ